MLWSRLNIYFFCLIFSLIWVSKVNALTVRPDMRDLESDPGNTITTIINIENNEPFVEIIDFEVLEFTSGEKEGVPEFYKDPEDDHTKWVQVPIESFALGPGVSRQVPVKIVIPPNSDPGGYYFGVFAGAQPQTEGTVSVRTSVGTLLFLTVRGEVVRETNISDFDIKPKKLLFFPAKFVYTIENTGTVHVKPRGQVRINNLFSPLIHLIDINPEFLRILPSSSRTIEVEWDGKDSVWWSSLNPFRVGFFEAELFFEGMEGNKIISKRFFMASPALYVLLLLVLGIIYKRKCKR